MTATTRRSVRRGHPHRPPSSQAPRSFPPRSSRPHSQPTLHDFSPDQLPPTPVGASSSPYPPQGITQAPPHENMRVLDTLIDTRKLSIAELDRLQDAIDSRDAGIEGRARIIECQRRGMSKLDKIIATKQHTLEHQRKSNADLHLALEKARREHQDLRNQLRAEKTKPVATDVKTSHPNHGPAARPMDTAVQTKPVHKATVNAGSDACLRRDTDSRVTDACDNTFRLNQEVATAEEGQRDILADFTERERLLQDKLEEAAAVIKISQAKLPELLAKSKRVDQLDAELELRQTTIQNFRLSLEQRDAEQIRDLAALKASLNLKADEAVELGRRMVDLMFAKVPWQYVDECLPELQAMEESFRAALSRLST